MTDLTGKRVLVTGATGALGSRIASGLAANDAVVVVSGRTDAKLTSLDVSATTERYAVDLAIPGAAAALIEAVAADGQIDGLVIAHGVVAFGAVDELTADAAETLERLNYASPQALIRAAQPALKASAEAGNEPFVLTISGIISEMPTTGMAAYGASKAGLLGFVKAAQRELRRSKIRLLDARPPHTETGLAARAISGVAPSMPAGLDPDVVAARIVEAIVTDETDVPPTAFADA